FANRSGFELLDLSKTLEGISSAREFIKGIQEKKGFILLIGTQPAARKLVEEFAKKQSYPFVIERWLGGTLTNFQTISKRIQYLIKLKADRATGKLEKYTKKERIGFDREIARLEELMGGLEVMLKLPDAVLIVDAAVHDTAVREARKMKIPIIALLNTDNNPDVIQYPIPGNTASQSSLNWILSKLF
ncbi:MAG: 30S ribosomal protein S2, partial [Patescibacteria group bacterium]